VFKTEENTIQTLKETVSEVAENLGINSDLIYRWRRQMRENGELARLFYCSKIIFIIKAILLFGAFSKCFYKRGFYETINICHFFIAYSIHLLGRQNGYS
jgi:hypothetical protein